MSWLDDEEAFISSLGAKMQEQAEQGIHIGAAPDDEPEPEHHGITIKRRKIVEELPEAVEYIAPVLTKRLATVDTETDPFAVDREPAPFCVGYAEDDGEYHDFWGDDCIDQFFAFLYERRDFLKSQGVELVIYAHNGGKFDFHFFRDYMDEGTQPFLIHNRWAKVMIAGVEFRDSYSILPVKLAKLQNKGSAKTEIDYNKMERLFREQNKPEILEYLRMDCVTLLDSVRDFIARFGWRLTIAGTALPYLRSFHGFAEMDPEHDEKIRPFYKGGRVQCFESGILDGPFVMVDCNSMYPAAMAQFDHPISAMPRRTSDMDECDFALIECENRGALGRYDGIDFDFTARKGEFFASIHEIRAGLETDTLKIKRVKQAWKFQHHSRFNRFVDHFYSARLSAKAEGDTAGTEFYKLILNSAYGKLAMNTIDYKDYWRNPPHIPTPLFSSVLQFEDQEQEDGTIKTCCTHSPRGWRLHSSRPGEEIWTRPTRGAGERFFNVATAASITGAARAQLWRAICASERPVYCDTDSIVCKAFRGEVDEHRLGAWKVEASGDALCVAGKKMYAFLSKDRPAAFDPKKHEELLIDGQTFYVLKKASKGVQLRGEQIAAVCRGEVIMHENESPTFNMDGSMSFVKRSVRMTTKKGGQGDLFLSVDESIK